MPFFDFLDEIESSALTRPAPQPGPVGVSQPGSMMPQSVNTQKRGKKTKIPVHRIKPMTPLDKQKLENFFRGGSVSPEELMQYGINYEVDPDEGSPRGVGMPQDSMLQNVQDPNKTIQGDLGDLGRMMGLNVDQRMKEHAEAGKAREEFYKSKLEVQKMQKESALAEEPEAPTPEAAAADKQAIDQNARAVEKQHALTGDDGSPGRDSMFEVFSALAPGGNGKKEFVQQASKALDGIFKSGIIIDPMTRVAFWAAMPSYAEALGQEAYNRVVGPIAQNERELSRKGYANLQKKAEDQGVQADDEVKAKAEERKRILTDLANDDVLNTPLGITAFILMSLILGPNMSAFILTRSKNRGKLQAELQEANIGIKEARDRKRSAFEMGQKASFAALDSEDRFGLQAQEAGERKQSRFMDHVYRMHEMNAEYEARKRLQGGKEDPAAKHLMQSFNQQKNIMGVAEREVDRLREEVKSWSSQAGSAIDGKMQSDFKKRWADAEKRLAAAEARMAEAEAALMDLGEKWNRYSTRYGNAPSQVQPAAEAGGE